MKKNLTRHEQSPTYALRHAAALVCALAMSGTQAADFTFLTHPDLAGRITLDPYLGNADDFFAPGLNTIGGASQFVWLCCKSYDVYGFLGGSMTTGGVTPFGLRSQQYFGLNRHTAQSLFGEWNSNALLDFNNTLTQTMPTGSTSSIVIAENQTYTTSFVLYDSAIGGHLSLTGQGYYELSWQNPGVHGGDEAGHFAFVRNYLPQGWQGVAHELQNWEILDGPYAGVTGFTTTTFYTTDYRAIPQTTTPTVLGAPWVTSGYAALHGPDNLVVGSPDTPAMDGTASLSGGQVVSLSSLAFGSEGSASLMVQGAGTRLEAGSISEFGLGTVAHDMQVLDGATVTASQVYLYGANSTLEVSGEGATLLQPACANCGGSGLYKYGSQMDVTHGGRIEVDSEVGGAVQMVSTHATVDGPGSTLRVRDGAAGMNATPAYAVILLDAAGSLAITDGGQVSIDSDASAMNGFWAGALDIYGPTAQPSTVLVDGAGSTLDGDRLVDIGALMQWDGVSDGYSDVNAPGALAILTVRNGGVVTADDILIGQAGTVTGDGGTLVGNVENRGTVAPGESPGTLTILGDYTQTEDGRLVIEIAGSGPGEFDVLEVSGSFTAGGTLEIQLLDGYIPEAGASFAFLIADTLTGAFDDYVLPSFGNGETLRVRLGTDGFVATVVPVPGAVYLFASALAGLAALRKRSRAATSSA